MTADLQTELKQSLARIESVFTIGRLCDKRDEMNNLRQSGETMLFFGVVKWSILLPDYDKLLNGESESLDDAFGDMSKCLGLLANDHADDTHVMCAVEAVAGTGEEKS